MVIELKKEIKKQETIPRGTYWIKPHRETEAKEYFWSLMDKEKDDKSSCDH